MNKIERLTSEILLLQEGKRGSEELAELLEVSKRTIIRDMRALCEMGVPVIARDGINGGYALPAEYSLQPLQLTWKEMLLLLMALGGLAKMADSPFVAERTTLLAKINALLPAKHRERVEGLLDKVGLDIPERTQRSPMLQTLVELLEHGKWARLTYRSGGPAYQVDVKPIRITSDRGLWYLRAVAGGEERAYRVDRVEAAEECAAPDSQPLELVPYDDPSHPLVRVELGPKGVQRVEADQHLCVLVVGAEAPITIEFRCPPSELTWYARFFGEMDDQATVLAPHELIALIVRRAANTLKKYEKI